MSAQTRARLRIAVPFVLCAVCLFVAGYTSPIVTAVLLVAGFGLFLDGATLPSELAGAALRAPGSGWRPHWPPRRSRRTSPA